MLAWNDLTLMLDELDALRAQLREARAQERTVRFHRLLRKRGPDSALEHVANVTELSGGGTLVHWLKDHQPTCLYPSSRAMMAALVDTGEYLASFVDVSERREQYGHELKTAHQALTPTERAVLMGISHGLTNAEIALKLGLAYDTIRNVVTHLFSKLDVNSRTQAALLGRDMDLLPLDDAPPPSSR